jgi:DnaK suppressor protein
MVGGGARLTSRKRTDDTVRINSMAKANTNKTGGGDLRAYLERERDKLRLRIHRLRNEQEDDVTAPPADELDAARSLADVETHAGIIEQHEARLKEIEIALDRFDRGEYGRCVDCGEEIPTERLRAMPATIRCVDCQQVRNMHGEGALTREFARRWDPPAEIGSTLEELDEMKEPEEELFVHAGSERGPEEGEFEQLPPAPTARRRGRVKKAQ